MKKTLVRILLIGIAVSVIFCPAVSARFTADGLEKIEIGDIVFLGEDNLDLIILVGNTQALSPEGQYLICKDILEFVKGYDIDRIYKVDLAILVLAVFEIEFEKSTPQNVVINEAVELAKKYSTDKSYSFINGVLAKVINK